MKRRSFLWGGLASLFGLVSFRPSRVYQIIDYSDSSSDQWGRVFRRSLENAEIPAVYVKRAYVMSDGSLEVTVWDRSLSKEEKVAQSFIARSKLIYEQCAKSFVALRTGNIPRDDWKVSQYDGAGKLLKVITASDFQ